MKPIVLDVKAPRSMKNAVADGLGILGRSLAGAPRQQNEATTIQSTEGTVKAEVFPDTWDVDPETGKDRLFVHARVTVTPAEPE